ncbi:hypothetical protein SGUI_2149 [Serinicoccus hydrothermalis]|uniref:N-acetyltransferase domain-containing protein n=1 Tax=Serinicoccus hydrothermalis TaxID=1758689 RepID=A0A1B1NDW5_9MICO|nr:hypothetical protein SGUI_2149 [Serinicoccus hydrothermalis]
MLTLANRLSTGAAPWRDLDAVVAVTTGWVREAVDAPDGDDIWVARENDHVVGFVHVGTRTHWTGAVDAYVGELAVAASHTGRGIGELLMRRAEEWAREAGHTRLTLETGAGNAPARRFYAGLGYVTEEVVLTRDLTV